MMSAFCEVTWCWRYLSILSNITLRYYGIERKGRASLLKLTWISSHSAFLVVEMEDCRRHFCSAQHWCIGMYCNSSSNLRKQHEVILLIVKLTSLWNVICILQTEPFRYSNINTLAPGWFRGFSKKTPKRTWFCVGISPVRYALQTQ